MNDISEKMLFYLVMTGGTVKTQLKPYSKVIGLELVSRPKVYLVMTGGTVKTQLKPYSKGLMIGLGLVSRLGE